MPESTTTVPYQPRYRVNHPVIQLERGSFAVIAVGRRPERQYLLQWNENWHMFNLIGGKMDNGKGDADSYLRTIQRELQEELGLCGPDECAIEQELMHFQMRQFSIREQRVKLYHFAVFEANILPHLDLERRRANLFARWLSTGRENVFVTGDEIERLITVHGRPISRTTRRIMRELGEISVL